jgi:hypothetical protein
MAAEKLVPDEKILSDIFPGSGFSMWIGHIWGTDPL